VTCATLCVALTAAACSSPPDVQSLSSLLPADPAVSFGRYGHLPGAGLVPDLETVVFPVDPARSEYPRIPVLLRAPNALVAVASIRRGSIDDAAPSSLRSATSTDGGRTWNYREIAINTTTADGDAAGVVDPATGEVLVLGRDLYASADDGATWTTRPLVVLPNAAGVVGDPGGPGTGLVVQHGPHAGRLVVMCRATVAEPLPEVFEALAGRPSSSNCTLTSDDHGATWRTSSTVQTGVGEGAVVELGDGRLYMSSRTYLYDGRRSEAYSDDGGSTWTALGRSVLPEPAFGVNGSMVRAVDPATGAATVVYANVPEWSAPFGLVPPVRHDLSLYVSDDETRSWKFGAVLHRGPSAYSSMVAAGTQVGVLYEAVVQGVNDVRSPNDPADGIRFASFDLSAARR
jgi:sialidase-1